MISSIFSYIILYLPLIAFFAIAYFYHRKHKQSMTIYETSSFHAFPLWSFLYLPFSILYFHIEGYMTAHFYTTLDQRFMEIFFAAGILILPALFYPVFAGVSLFLTSVIKKEAVTFHDFYSRWKAYVRARIFAIVWFIAVPLFPYARIEALTLIHGREFIAPFVELNDMTMISDSRIDLPVFFRVISIHNERAAVYAIYSGADISGKKLEAAAGFIIRFKKEDGKWVYKEDTILWGGNSDDYSFPPY